MRALEFGMVITSIMEGDFLDEFYLYFKEQGGLDRIRLYLIGDLKSPPSLQNTIEKYRALGLDWHYFDVPAQEKFMKPFPELYSEIPLNSDNRRNIGFLMALADGCSKLIAIDDDNFPLKSYPFLEGHGIVGTEVSRRVAVGSESWFNLCSMMNIQCESQGSAGMVYPRGFPYARRQMKASTISDDFEKGFVAVNAGLWTGDPDVDAMTRIVTRCQASIRDSESYLLAKSTLMPINTQNTTVIAEAIPAYYFVKMGFDVNGMRIDRYGDIFSGFFIQKCVAAMGHRVSVGPPVVDHRRSPHNLFKDAWQELACIVLIEDMLELLERPLTPASCYGDAVNELSERILSWSKSRSGFLWNEGSQSFFEAIAKNMNLWVNVCRQLRGKAT